MVIEHTFVTTKDAMQTMQSAMQFLGARGFERSEAAFPIGGEWTTLEMRRGKKKAARAKNIAQLPQTAHVQWDRGRVTVVLSIEPNYVWGGSGAQIGFHIGPSTGNPKKMKLHTTMLSAIATGLEQVLVYEALPDLAAQPWQAADEEARRLATRRIWRNVIIAIAVIAIFVVIIALVAAYAK